MQPEDTMTIAKSRVDEWVAQLMRGAQVIAPVSASGEDVTYSPISSPAQVLWRFTNSLHPPKECVLPQTDPIVSIKRNGGHYDVQPVHDDRPRIMLNLRSCDVKGMAFLRQVHAADLPDESYLKRAKNITLISLACTTPGPYCFCTCTDSGPFAREGYDLQLTDLGNRLLVEAGSDLGRALADEAGALFTPAEVSDLHARLRLEEQARSSFGQTTCHFASAMRRISTGRVQDELWAQMSDWCLECGACNLVCPTCYCFSVKDKRQDDRWVRCRIWDSCQYAAFTLEASGHNPRPERKDRMKRRFFHKVSAQYYTRDGMVGCVGCGRCVKVCLGASTMPAVVAAVRKGVWNA